MAGEKNIQRKIVNGHFLYDWLFAGQGIKIEDLPNGKKISATGGGGGGREDATKIIVRETDPGNELIVGDIWAKKISDTEVLLKEKTETGYSDLFPKTNANNISELREFCDTKAINLTEQGSTITAILNQEKECDIDIEITAQVANRVLGLDQEKERVIVYAMIYNNSGIDTTISFSTSLSGVKVLTPENDLLLKKGEYVEFSYVRRNNKIVVLYSGILIEK